MNVKHLFKPLDKKLIELLESLRPEEWNCRTVAKKWNVKDVVSHLLDGNIRALSLQRDKYFGDTPPSSNTYGALVEWLNTLNADWVKATKRISPSVLIFLHKATGGPVCDYFESLNVDDEAIFPVDWAGESKSRNGMHLAREYTEKWHHQQQIREATGREGIMTKEFFYPFIDTFFLGLPHTFKTVDAETGTVVKIKIPASIGGVWFLQKQQHRWELVTDPAPKAFAATVEIPASISWKLFSKSVRPNDILDQVTISGDSTLGLQVLNMVSVMA